MRLIDRIAEKYGRLAMDVGTTATPVALDFTDAIKAALTEFAQSGEPVALTFDAFRAANKARCIKWHPEGIASWSPSDWLTAVTGELGELASLLKMRNRERDGLPGNKFSPTDKQVADEIADVLTYLDLLAEVLGVNLGKAAAEKFNEISERVGFPDRIDIYAHPSPEPAPTNAPTSQCDPAFMVALERGDHLDHRIVPFDDTPTNAAQSERRMSQRRIKNVVTQEHRRRSWDERRLSKPGEWPNPQSVVAAPDSADAELIYRKATTIEALGVLLARYSDKFSPAEKDEVRSAMRELTTLSNERAANNESCSAAWDRAESAEQRVATLEAELAAARKEVEGLRK